MNNLDLGYVREAIQNRIKNVDVLFIVNLPGETQPAFIKKTLAAKTVLKNLTRPFDQRSSGWKKIVPINYVASGQTIPASIKVDMNSLSDPKLLENIAANPEMMKALKAMEKESKKVTTETPAE